ncbi:MAG: hypothetical protein ACM3SS_14930 [Rhodospirillaceae bacterium]
MKRIIIHVLQAALLTLASAPAADACAAPEKTFHLSIVRGQVKASERVLRVEQGDRVHLTAASDAAGELHLHGYRLEAKLTPGTMADLAFKAYATGRYPLEWHPASDKARRFHHGPPLAVVEVHPK